jgi:hypothetical protein
MPSSKNPLLPEFYVYGLEARGVLFYIGIGRSARASDRIRYVRYLMKREASGKPVKWVLSNQVVAELLKRGNEVRVWYLDMGSQREQALTRERQEIERLVSAGAVLANCQHNDGGPESAEVVVKSVISRGKPRGQRK